MLRALGVGLAMCASAASADTVTVFAAASLQGPVEAVARSWQETTGHLVQISFAGTPQLARQIAAGAPADIFIAASADWMDALSENGVVRSASRVDIAGNSLVLVGHGQMPPSDIATALAALKDDRLAMALVDSVPAGQYGKAALEDLGLWDAVAPQVVQADNVRAALALVAAGEAPLGIVYATDARAEPRVSVVATFPAGSHPAIVYPAALTAGAVPAAQGLLDALAGPVGRAAFAAAGFSAP
jgi:molybdate transport system substrate-binding protein